jgi:hemolysin activation/secretion protein
MKNNQFITLVWTSCITAVSAQQIPNTGGQSQPIPVTTQPSISQPVPLQIRPGVSSQPSEKSEQSEVSVPVKSIQLLGMRSYSELELLAQTGFTGEGLLTLTQLRVMAERIADFYH